MAPTFTYNIPGKNNSNSSQPSTGVCGKTIDLYFILVLPNSSVVNGTETDQTYFVQRTSTTATMIDPQGFSSTYVESAFVVLLEGALQGI